MKKENGIAKKLVNRKHGEPEVKSEPTLPVHHGFASVFSSFRRSRQKKSNVATD